MIDEDAADRLLREAQIITALVVLTILTGWALILTGVWKL